MNEESTPKSSLDLTLMWRPRDENLELGEERTYFEVDPLRAWYYNISLNFHTLVILLQVDLAFSDELEIICEGCYETKNTSIFTWFSIPGVEHYSWLHSPIC